MKPETINYRTYKPERDGLFCGGTVELFAKEIIGAKTVVWNGPMGVFEMPNYAKGTIGVCEAIANLQNATLSSISLGLQQSSNNQGV